MAKKNFYAVKKGKQTGIFSSWESCKAVVEGYPGAVYKGFVTETEAEAFLNVPGQGETAAGSGSREEAAATSGRKIPGSAGAAAEDKEIGAVAVEGTASGTRRAAAAASGRKIPGQTTAAADEESLIAYVDGSFDEGKGKYSFGCVLITPEGAIVREFGNGNDPDSLALRNVTGEMLGAMFAVKWCFYNGYKSLDIRYDYKGIEMWATGGWRAKNDRTQKYRDYMREMRQVIDISFTKIAAHTGNQYNEEADLLAKRGLTEGKGIPEVRKLREYETN